MPKHGHGVNIDDALWNSVVVYAEEDSRSCSQVVGLALEEFFNRLKFQVKKKNIDKDDIRDARR